MNNYNVYGQTGTQSAVRSSAFATLMRNVYSWMTLGLIMTAMTAWYVAHNLTLVSAIMGNPGLLIGLMIVEVAMVWILSARVMKMSMTTAGIMFAAYAILNGVTMSFIFLAYTTASVAQAFFISAGTFGTMSLVGYFVKKDLSAMGRILYMALIGLIIATLANFFFHSTGMAMLLNYAGVIIFVGLTAYDTQKIKLMFESASQYGVTEETPKLALLGSLTLYLDFVNLFLYILRLFGNRR